MNKKGVATVVETVLLVLITMAAVVLVSAFVINLVRTNLEKGKTCYELREYFKLSETGNSCTNASTTRLMIERSNEDEETQGFIVSIATEDELTPYIIKNGTNGSAIGGVKMRDDSEILVLPRPGEAKTYIFNKSNARSADISVLNQAGKSCDKFSYTISACN